MTNKLKYRLQEGEEILWNPNHNDLKGKAITVVVVKGILEDKETREVLLPIEEKELVKKVKKTKTTKKNKTKK